jgi:hypothetical protein
VIPFSATLLSRVFWLLLLTAWCTLVAQGSAGLSVANLPEEPLPQTASSSQQEVPPQPIQDDEQEKKKQREQQAEQELKQQEKQHLFGVVPTYNAVNTGKATPLNAKQKFQLAFTSAVTPYQFALTGVVAGIGQAQDSFPEYGQGAEGYAKRFGAGYADSFNGAILGNALFPVLLHQDPRYFRKGTGSFKSRLFYAIGTSFRCKGDNGKWQPNISNLLGNIAAGGISNLYYPASSRGVGLAFERGFVVTAEGALGGVLLEFAPDIEKHLRKKLQPVQP